VDTVDTVTACIRMGAALSLAWAGALRLVEVRNTLHLTDGAKSPGGCVSNAHLLL
jgi:hypothetical protein